MFLTPAARAGTYAWTQTDSNGNVTAHSPVYSGGTWYGPGPNNVFGDYPDVPRGDGWGGGSGGSKSADCKGPITTTFTWKPADGQTAQTDPPPQSVVVLEKTSTQASGASNPPGTVGGSCDDGFSHSQSMSQTGLYAYPGSSLQVGTSGSAALDGTRYSSKPGDAVSLTCTPTASASASATASSSLTYTASVTPVVIVLTGTTVDNGGGQNILIGQGCGASLSGIPSGTGWTVTYQWSVTGTTFQQWKPTTPQIGTTPANPNASYYVPGPGPLINSTAHWYWNEAVAPETISCTVTITPPAGQGNTFTVTANKQVSVNVPPYGFSHHEGIVWVTNTGDYVQCTGIQQHYPHGETWDCQVLTPSMFGSGGLCNLVQIVTPGRSKTYSPGDAGCSENGKTGLDGFYPYPSSQNDPYSVSVGSNSGWPADNSVHQAGDSPDSPINATVLGFSINESFSTYLMYLPPGGDVYPVPLHILVWKWAATMSQPTGGWSNAPNGYPFVNPPSITSTTDQRTYDHPTWTKINSTATGTGW